MTIFNSYFDITRGYCIFPYQVWAVWQGPLRAHHVSLHWWLDFFFRRAGEIAGILWDPPNMWSSLTQIGDVKFAKMDVTWCHLTCNTLQILIWENWIGSGNSIWQWVLYLQLVHLWAAYVYQRLAWTFWWKQNKRVTFSYCKWWFSIFFHVITGYLGRFASRNGTRMQELNGNSWHFQVAVWLGVTWLCRNFRWVYFTQKTLFNSPCGIVVFYGFLALEWPCPSPKIHCSPVDEGVISPHGSDILDEEGIVAGPQ